MYHYTCIIIRTTFEIYVHIVLKKSTQMYKRNYFILTIIFYSIKQKNILLVFKKNYSNSFATK